MVAGGVCARSLGEVSAVAADGRCGSSAMGRRQQSAGLDDPAVRMANVAGDRGDGAAHLPGTGGRHRKMVEEPRARSSLASVNAFRPYRALMECACRRRSFAKPILDNQAGHAAEFAVVVRHQYALLSKRDIKSQRIRFMEPCSWQSRGDAI
ncbi:MAG: hypothetical protein JWN04_5227 [Myxococcaceae bacterium]|nr:hypothetical protein [Myxococcaceae bacterium]